MVNQDELWSEIDDSELVDPFSEATDGSSPEDGGETELYEHRRVVADSGQNPVRVDKFLMDHLRDTSRNRIQKAAEAGYIQANGKPVKSNYKVKAGDIIRTITPVCGGKGGGKPDSAMGGGSDVVKLDDAMAMVDNIVAKALGL